jgi:ATP-binding cassette subfamily C protein
MSREEVRREVRALLSGSLRCQRPAVVRLLAWSTVAALPVFLSGLLIARATDDGFLTGDVGTGLAWLAALGAAVLVGGWAKRQTFLYLAAIVEPFRDVLVERTVRGALRRATAAGAERDATGVARLTQQVEIAREAYASVLIVVQSFLLTTVGSLLGLLVLTPLLLAFVMPPLAVALVVFAAALPGMAQRQRAAILADARIGETAGTVTGGLRDIVACGGEARAAAIVGEHVDARARATRELARFTAIRTLAVAVGGWLPVLLILLAGPWLLRRGISTGEILGALTYVSQGLHTGLQTLVRGLGNMGLWLLVSLTRIVEQTGSAASEPAGPARPGARPAAASASAGPSLHVERVTFGYGRSAEPVICELDLTLDDNDRLAVVGPSGGGKSTLACLAAGLLTPQAGTVRIAGVAVAELGQAAAAAHRTLIPQESYVFAGSLRENLAYLRDDVSDAELDDAVQCLGAARLVARLGGYDAELDPGVLSAGERQLLTLVRSYLSPARLAILDEATCHLDPAAEARVERAFAARDGALIVIAHRMSSALRARRILVLDGRQSWQGTHEELLASSPPYRDLVGHWDSGRAGRRARTAGVVTRVARRL